MNHPSLGGRKVSQDVAGTFSLARLAALAALAISHTLEKIFKPDQALISMVGLTVGKFDYHPANQYSSLSPNSDEASTRKILQGWHPQRCQPFLLRQLYKNATFDALLAPYRVFA